MHKSVKTTGIVLVFLGVASWAIIVGAFAFLYAFMRWWS